MTYVPYVNIPLNINPPSQAASAHTIQAMMELVYIQVANSVLVNNLASLQTALTTTKNAVDTLTQLQTLHNEVKVQDKGNFNTATGFNYNTTFYSSCSQAVENANYENAYRTAASAFFGKPILISINYAAGGVSTFLTQITTLRNQIAVEIHELSSTTPLISGHEDPNSLVAKLRKVLTDLVLVTTPTAAATWLIDNYNTQNTSGGTSGGAIQQNITNAITAAQSLNTTQTESVRNFLYLFEEYYKSATAMLQQITQIIQTMAQHVGGN